MITDHWSNALQVYRPPSWSSPSWLWLPCINEDNIDYWNWNGPQRLIVWRSHGLSWFFIIIPKIIAMITDHWSNIKWTSTADLVMFTWLITSPWTVTYWPIMYLLLWRWALTGQQLSLKWKEEYFLPPKKDWQLTGRDLVLIKLSANCHLSTYHWRLVTAHLKLNWK